MRNAIAILVFLALIVSIGFADDLTDCWTAISPAGYYRLTQDVSNPYGLDKCFVIKSSNVELDCNGHSITNNDTAPQTTFGVYLSGHYTNVTIRNCVIKNYGYGGYNGYGVFLEGWDDPDNFTVVNNTAINNSYAAFEFAQDSNCTIANNTAYGNSSSANGFSMSYSSGNTLINNTAYILGIGLNTQCNNNMLINNRVYNSSVGIGISWWSYNNTLAGNTVVNASYADIYIIRTDNITLSDNVIIGGSLYGYEFEDGSGANMTNNTAINISGSGWSGFQFFNYSNNVVVGNKAYNASESFVFTDSSNNTVANNTASDGWARGFEFTEAYGENCTNTNNTIINNTASGKGYGFIIATYNSTIANNTEANSNWGGIDVYYDNNAVIGNTAYNSTYSSSGEGLYVSGNNLTIAGNNASNNHVGIAFYGSGITFANNTASGSGFIGIYFLANNTLADNNTASNSSVDGFRNGGGSNITFTNSVASGNGYYGFNMGANFTASGIHLFDNGVADIHLVGPGNVNLSDIIIDNPVGNFTDYTNLSLYDTIGSGQSYSLSWSGQPAPLPSWSTSFESKYLQFSTSFGSPSIDSMTWQWNEDEVSGGGYNESKLRLYGYSGSWSVLNTTPDTSAHTLGLSDFAPSGVVGILEYSPPPPSCPPPINTTGYHELNQTAYGSSNNASDFYSGAVACVVINSSDVVFDCNGFNITNDGSGDSMGIFVDGESGPLTNVVIRNCPGISGYNFGIYGYATSGSNFTNLTILDNSWDGLELDSSAENNIMYNDFEGNDYGVAFYGSTTNNITHNAFSSNYEGVYLGSTSNGNLIIYNNMTGNYYGFYVDTSDNNQMGYNNIVSTYSSNYLGGGSCPLAYAWNGTGYGFFADISGTGLLGVDKGNGTYRPPVPQDYAKIGSGQLQQENGTYDLQITQEYDEVSYLDQLALLTVDHSPDVDVYTGLPKADLDKIFTVSKHPSAPVSCTDSNGSDCLPAVLGNDDVYVGENSTLVLDLGDLSNASTISLILGGFSEWGGTTQKSIEVKNAGGNWVTAYSNSQLNAPAGMPRTYVVNMTGRFLTNDYSVRIKFFNSARLGYVAIDTTPQQPVDVHTYSPSYADLHYRGYSKTAEGDVPYPDYYTLVNETDFVNQTGNFTRFGDVQPLLNATDDEYVILHHGDEISVQFPYSAVPVGQGRDFLLYSWDYYKSLKHVNGSTVDPLPFAAMSNYPYPANESYPNDAEHRHYLSHYDTRVYNATFGAGISLPNSLNNTIFNNNITGDSGSTGLDLYMEEGSTVRDNSISGVRYGLYIDTSLGVNASGNNISDCGDRGIYIYNSDQTYLANNYLRNDSDGFVVRENAGSTVTYNATGMIFDNPVGGFSDYTNLSLFGTVNDGEGYSLGWAEQPAPLPPGARSFENKYLTFSTSFGSPSIDSMTWSWQESEVILGGHNESILGLYGYTGSWSPMNTTPDNSTHTLGFSDYVPDGVIGILEVTPPTCPLPIDTPGEYPLGQDASGAPNDASDFDSGWGACVLITSSDVAFDCNGHTITNDGTSDSIGIFVDGYPGALSNITIRNCPGISGYNFGIFAHGTSGSNFTNLTASNNSWEGLDLESSSNNNVLDSAFNGGDGDGAYLWHSSANSISNSTFNGNRYSGVYLDSGSGNVVIGNTASGNGDTGIGTSGEQNDTIANNTVSGSSTGMNIGEGPAPAPSYELYSDTYTTIDSPETHTFSYDVNSDNSLVVLMIAGGYYGFSSVSLPLGCTEQQFVTGPDSYETGYIATCTQDAGSYNVDVTSDDSDTYLSFAAYVFPPGSSVDDMNADTSTGNDLSVALPPGDDLYLCAGGAGNGPLSYVSGTIDAENPAVGSSGDGGSAAWHQSDYTCYEETNDPTLVLVGAAIVINGSGTPALMNTISNNTIHNNEVGLSMYDSGTNTALAYGHLYGNGQDMLLSEDLGESMVLNAAGMIFDNPSGNLTNYTNLSISDTISSESYSINWSAQPDTPPDNLSSFRQKFVNITPLDGSPSIESINWSWTNASVSGYNESSFRLYEYGPGGWSDTGAALDEASHTLSLSGLVPASIYGILGNVTEAGNISVALDSPVDGYNASKRAITFSCSANASLDLSDITLYGNFTGSWQANKTNSVSGTSNSTEFTLNLSYAQYAWNCLAYDTDGNSAWAPANYTFTADSLPRASDFGGSTTNFNNELDLQNVSAPILENTTHGILQWNGSGLDVAGADFDSYVLFGTGWVSVDSSHLSPTLNSPANITLYGLPYQYMPIVYSDGVLCADCTILSYASHNLAFTVQHFTNYSAGPNTNLAIYDQYEGSNVSKLTDITFYANYTNATDSSHVAGATCTISFDDATSGTMVDTGTQYNYTKAAGFSTTGIHLWNVTCNETGYETLFAQDDVDIGPLNLTGNMTSLYMANVTNATALPRFEYNGSGNLTTAGGNITGVDVSTEMLTDRWAAFYGNITGSIMLTDKEGANNVYQWGWTPTDGGVVCTSTNSSVTDLMLYPADGDDIDAAWSFAPTEADSGRNTFTQTGCDLTIGTTSITNASYADTGQPGGFVTCSLKDTTIAAKKDMFFCTNITQNGVFWNNQTGDFELVVPTAFGSNVYETYYFYVNLD